ncbi:MAG: RHS repeat-associated core domain-containing protein, partial [Gemmatimonadales bacterium]
ANRNGRADWVGSLIRDQRDPSGLLYRRNRYYDPMAGRFTQPDPIGLAGGLNLYGFAGGDPANFTDPFGLCAPGTPPWLCPENWLDALATAAHEVSEFVGGLAGWLPGLKPASESLAGRSFSGEPLSGSQRTVRVAQAAGEIGAGVVIGRGLRGASAGLRKLFASSGGLADNSVIGVRATLLKSGFRQTLSENRQGYLFVNELGEQVRIMRGESGWYLRIRNQYGNYLDALGNPGPRDAATHLPLYDR